MKLVTETVGNLVGENVVVPIRECCFWIQETYSALNWPLTPLCLGLTNIDDILSKIEVVIAHIT